MPRAQVLRQDLTVQENVSFLAQGHFTYYVSERVATVLDFVDHTDTTECHVDSLGASTRNPRPNVWPGPMQITDIDGIDIAYEQLGNGAPLLLLTGLGGVGRAWGNLVERFAADYTTIVPDHRGTGASSQPPSGYTIEALAADMAGLVRHIGLGPAHIVGSSTGGAIAQVMAIDHPDTVRSMVLVSSWAGPDPYFLSQFEVRKSILEHQGVAAYARSSSLFLFAPSFAAAHPDVVGAWVEKATLHPADPEIMRQRIDMIMVHDQRQRLVDVSVPTLVIVGDEDICTPPHASEELAGLIRGSRLDVIPGGHLIYLERADEFVRAVSTFMSHVDQPTTNTQERS